MPVATATALPPELPPLINEASLPSPPLPSAHSVAVLIGKLTNLTSLRCERNKLMILPQSTGG